MLITTLAAEPVSPIARVSTSSCSLKARQRTRLFCFHHAGGGGTSFNLWKRGLAPDVEVVPVEIHNRERFATLSDLVEEVNRQLGPALDEPHMFFGHSFGALVSYRLACLRSAAGLVLPRALFVSSFAPPHLPSPIPIVDRLDDHQLGQVLSEIGGLPVELTRWPKLREKAVALARIDLRLCTTDIDSDTVPLTCPIHAIGGSDDPLVSESDLHEWSRRTSAGSSLHMLEGGHFYCSNRERLFAVLRPLLSEFGSSLELSVSA